jgi:hypothetical protein
MVRRYGQRATDVSRWQSRYDHAMQNGNDVPENGLVDMVGDIVRNTIEAYQRSPVLRMLVKLHPDLAVAEVGILATYAWFQNRRLQLFADEFTTLGLTITKQDAERQEFFDAYTSTAQHVLTESRDAKIRLFARLFGEFLKGGCATPIDRYEEYLLLLDEISGREFNLLLLLERHEARHPRQPGENPLQRATRFWVCFEGDAEKEFGIDGDVLQGILGRLTRTGMYIAGCGNTRRAH